MAEAGEGVLKFFGLNNSDSTVRKEEGLVDKTQPLLAWASEVVGGGLMGTEWGVRLSGVDFRAECVSSPSA